LPAADVPAFAVVGERIVPDWLTAVDEPWLQRLLAVAEAGAGARTSDVEARMLAVPGPAARVRVAAATLLRLSVTERAGADARRWRREIFRAGARLPREEAIRSLGCAEDELWRRAFADLPSERRYRPPDPLPAAAELALRTNLRTVQALVQRAVALRVTLTGNARDVVRHVRRQGLLCVARPVPGGVELEISGVYALFRRTTLYGRALASVVPRLRWCERFVLEARVVVGARELVLRHGPSDPVWPSAPPRTFDSRLEAAFAKDLARRFPEWEAVREPEPLEADGRLVFPDFAIGRRAEPDVRWLVEIAGFWTPEYLRAKLRGLAAARVRGAIVCVDAARNLGEGELPPRLSIVRYTRRIDVAQVIAAAEAMPAGTVREHVHTEKLDPGDVYLDYAGRLPYDSVVHAALARLQAGDPVDLVEEGGSLFVVADGAKVALLSRRARARWTARLPAVTRGRVHAVVERTSHQSHPDWRGLLKVDRWRVPLVEVAWTGPAQSVPSSSADSS